MDFLNSCKHAEGEKGERDYCCDGAAVSDHNEDATLASFINGIYWMIPFCSSLAAIFSAKRS